MTLAELHEHRAALRERVGKTDLAKQDELRAAEYRARADRGR